MTGDELRGGLRVAGRASGFLLLIGAVVYFAIRLLATLSTVVIPVGVALLLTALLWPGVALLVRRGVPRGLAAALALVGGLTVVGGLLAFVISALTTGLPDMRSTITSSIRSIRDWLANGPLRMSAAELDRTTDQLIRWLQGGESAAAGAFSIFSSLSEVIAGFLLALFTLFFFLYDGPRIWRFLLKAVPAEHRPRVDAAGDSAFHALVGYVRATATVALIDAVGIGIGLVVVGVPLVFPLAALVFLGGFVPYIGAFTSGLASVLVAFVTGGPWTALLVLGIVLAVQVIEGNVLEPLLMSTIVRLHPLAVVLAVAVGVVWAGLVGALLAVPVLTTLRAMITARPEETTPD